MRIEFAITIAGEGNTPEECWINAVEAFSQDPGICPDEQVKDEVSNEFVDEPKPGEREAHSPM